MKFKITGEIKMNCNIHQSKKTNNEVYIIDFQTVFHNRERWDEKMINIIYGKL